MSSRFTFWDDGLVLILRVVQGSEIVCGPAARDW
jgi:hypothetical protein